MLYLIPSVLGEDASIDALPPATRDRLLQLGHLVVETPKQARRFLKRAGARLGDEGPRIDVLDEHTPDARLPELLAPAIAGHEVGILSDAGCPGVADPGARLVRLAHERGVRVVPLVGPSAILLALMACGLEGQRFAFHGYLPVDAQRRDRALAALEREAGERRQTQIVIETPYRNQRLLEAMLRILAAETLLCVATDLSLPTEAIATRRIAQWRERSPDIDRRPTVFLIGAPAVGLSAAAAGWSTPRRAPAPPPSPRRSASRRARRYSRAG